MATLKEKQIAKEIVVALFANQKTVAGAYFSVTDKQAPTFEQVWDRVLKSVSVTAASGDPV